MEDYKSDERRLPFKVEMEAFVASTRFYAGLELIPSFVGARP